jgi:hypothetical protein
MAKRTPEETLEVVLRAKKLIDGGQPKEGPNGALKQVGIAKSVYDRYAKRDFQPKTGHLGRVRADSLPPRPRKGGKRVPRPVDLNDMVSVSLRIAKIAKKLKGIDALRAEHERLSDRLVLLATDGRETSAALRRLLKRKP